MKKSLKIILSVGVPTLVVGTATAIATPLTINHFKYKNRAMDYSKYLELSSKSEGYIQNSPALGDDVHQYAESSDINMFYTGWGTVTYTYMMRLALTSSLNSQVLFGFAPNADGLGHQKRTNANELQKFFDISKKESKVFNFGSDADGGSAVDKWYETIIKNPNKKINIWWNADHVDHGNGSYEHKILELAGFKNVNIHLLEDGAAMGDLIKNWTTNKEYANKFKTKKDFENIDKVTQYLVPTVFENVHTWISMPVVNQMKATDPTLYKNFHKLDTDLLGDKVFNTRINITDDQGATTTPRISSFWSKITGVNWMDAKKIFDNAKSENPSKKSLMILGSYGNSGEMDFIKNIYAKYHDNYNIFYKGHPGHPFYSDWIKNEYKNPGLYVLDPMIASEEITKEHIADGLVWDNVVCVGKTSAMDGFPEPTYNHDSILLEMLNADGSISNSSTADWPSVVQWIKDYYNPKP